MKYFLVIVLFLAIPPLHAQEKLDFGDTEKTDTHPTYKPNDRKIKQKKPIQWVKNSSKGLLIGNKCMEEVQQEMGFIYVIQHKGRNDTMNEVHRFGHNFAAKLKLFFKNGPFWKFKLKKKRKECRRLSGDFVG